MRIDSSSELDCVRSRHQVVESLRHTDLWGEVNVLSIRPHEANGSVLVFYGLCEDDCLPVSLHFLNIATLILEVSWWCTMQASHVKARHCLMISTTLARDLTVIYEMHNSAFCAQPGPSVSDPHRVE
eukprot:6194163-Amphidinium_carterae.1